MDHYGPLQCPVDTVHCPYLYFGLVQMQNIIKDLNIRLSGDTVLPVWPRRIHFMIFLKKLPPAQMFPIQFHFGNTRLLLKPLFLLPAPLQEIGWCSGCPLHPCSMRRPSASCSNLPPRLDPCRHRSISSPGHGLALFLIVFHFKDKGLIPSQRSLVLLIHNLRMEPADQR